MISLWLVHSYTSNHSLIDTYGTIVLLASLSESVVRMHETKQYDAHQMRASGFQRHHAIRHDTTRFTVLFVKNENNDTVCKSYVSILFRCHLWVATVFKSDTRKEEDQTETKNDQQERDR